MLNRSRCQRVAAGLLGLALVGAALGGCKPAIDSDAETAGSSLPFTGYRILPPEAVPPERPSASPSVSDTESEGAAATHPSGYTPVEHGLFRHEFPVPPTFLLESAHSGIVDPFAVIRKGSSSSASRSTTSRPRLPAPF